ncbi:MAG: condensation domain-containing protein, partial [Pirellulales bacterium]
PLARAAWFGLGAEESRLLLVVHHLVIDAVSWRTLLEDLTTVWRQLQDDEQPALPSKSTSFKQWSERLTDYARSPELEDELVFWRSLAEKQPAALPCDARGKNLQGDAEVVSSTWSAAKTGQLLNEAGAAYRMHTNEILLAALGQALGEWAGGQVLIDVEGHGRVPLFDDVDLSRTIGWFTAWFPHLSAASDLPPSALLRQTKEAFRGVPNQGLGFGVLRYLSPGPDIRARMAGLPAAQASFNYLGRMDEYLSSPSLTVVDEPVGPARSPRARRSHLIEINAAVFDGCLRVDWTFCRNLHHRETIERLAADFRDRLTALIAHCLSPDAGAFTPSDFPLARLNDSELDKLANLLGD